MSSKAGTAPSSLQASASSELELDRIVTDHSAEWKDLHIAYDRFRSEPEELMETLRNYCASIVVARS